MTTIILVFFIGFLAALLFTPIVSRIAKRYSLVDFPSERKIHKEPIPRIGGVALYFAFLLPVVLLPLNKNMYMDVVMGSPMVPLLVIGLTAAFLLGLWDDVRQLPAWFKFLGQVACAVFSYYAGIRINVVSFPFTDGIVLGAFSLPATIIWFVLVINAINLVDGLDGLAAGIGLFVSITMLAICLINGRVLEAVAFAALGGALIGFLNYNFHPASIFMGDSGSYFLGYLIASLSVMGSIKGQVATAMIIPVIALGVPLVDTLWAPIRRFALGQKMFQPDQGHLHHNLIKLGYTHRRAVLIMYGFTIVLGIISIFLVHANDETAAVILMIFGAGVIFVGRYVGVMEYFDTHRFGNWLKDMSDESGLSLKRRDFLNYQVAISRSQTIDQFWDKVCKTLEHLEFDLAELVLYQDFASPEEGNGQHDNVHRKTGSEDTGKLQQQDDFRSFTWGRKDNKADILMGQEGLLKVEQPLFGKNGDTHYFGTLFLVKEIQNQDTDYYALKRIEHLRRVMSATLEDIYKKKTERGQ